MRFYYYQIHVWAMWRNQQSCLEWKVLNCTLNLINLLTILLFISWKWISQTLSTISSDSNVTKAKPATTRKNHSDMIKKWHNSLINQINSCFNYLIIQCLYYSRSKSLKFQGRSWDKIEWIDWRIFIRLNKLVPSGRIHIASSSPLPPLYINQPDKDEIYLMLGDADVKKSIDQLLSWLHQDAGLWRRQN